MKCYLHTRQEYISVRNNDLMTDKNDLKNTELRTNTSVTLLPVRTNDLLRYVCWYGAGTCRCDRDCLSHTHNYPFSTQHTRLTQINQILGSINKV